MPEEKKPEGEATATKAAVKKSKKKTARKAKKATRKVAKGKRYSPAEKKALLKKWLKYQQQGMSAQDAAERTGVSFPSLYIWKKAGGKGKARKVRGRKAKPSAIKPRRGRKATRKARVQDVYKDAVVTLPFGGKEISGNKDQLLSLAANIRSLFGVE